MKRNLVAICFLLLVGMVGYAQSEYSSHVIEKGIEKGDTLFSLFAGPAFPLNKSGIKVESDLGMKELEWGNTGTQYGFSVLQFINSYLGAGVEVSGMTTAHASKWVDDEKLKTSMNLINAMLTARVNVNPHNPVRFYIPFGAGITSAQGKVKVADSDEASIKARTNSFGYFVGAGLETNLGSKGGAIGIETRYTGFRFNTDKFGDDGEKIAGKRNYRYLSVLLKLSYRF